MIRVEPDTIEFAGSEPINPGIGYPVKLLMIKTPERPGQSVILEEWNCHVQAFIKRVSTWVHRVHGR